MEQQYQINTPSDFKTVIKDCFGWYKNQSVKTLVITLSGDLGAGKTTFVQELGKVLGIKEPVTSPTFTIMKQYNLDGHPDFDQLVHIDAYRFESESEAAPLHIAEFFTHPRTIICLEWPERVANIVPAENIHIRIEITEGEKRKVTVKATPHK